MSIQKNQPVDRASSGLRKGAAVNSSLIKRKASISVARPLLHILGRQEKPGDLLGKHRAIAFQDGVDVYIARAELELRKAMELMAFDGAMGTSTLPPLTALSLPDSVTSLLWTTHAFLRERYPKPNDHNQIHHRNRDARMLYRQMAQLDLSAWANQLVDQVRYDEIPDGIYMPPGHPVPGKTYRCHPFRGRRNFYYPVDDYFLMLFREREQALMSLLSELGATKIVISSPPGDSIGEGGSFPIAQLHEKIFVYPTSVKPVSERFDVRQHPWLSCEPEWQLVVNERMNRAALSAQFEFGLDVAGMLKSQISSVAQFIAFMSSMTFSEHSQAVLMMQVLQLRRVQVTFGEFVP